MIAVQLPFARYFKVMSNWNYVTRPNSPSHIQEFNFKNGYFSDYTAMERINGLQIPT